MTTLFISYSRKDKEFAQRLNASLDDMGFESWVDWDDIPPTADWWDQIQKGIESADTFLFLLSPDSVKSEVCGREIDHAVKMGKRMIPVVVREVSPGEVHAVLTRLNWIFFREQDDFNASLQKLEAGLKTDLAWVETQRRLQVRAVEWDKRRDNSLLLRGKDLQDAELQLATNTSKDPTPTDLQRAYVLESRQAADRQRRMVTSHRDCRADHHGGAGCVWIYTGGACNNTGYGCPNRRGKGGIKCRRRTNSGSARPFLRGNSHCKRRKSKEE